MTNVERLTSERMTALTRDVSAKLVPTNLPGVLSKMRPDTASGTPTIAEMLHPTVLSQLMESQSPAIRTFRDKVLLRHWGPDDQIVPVLKPLIGVTHQLRSKPVKAANTAYTSNAWAGSVISGTWTAAFGIWRVPSVRRPSTAGGTTTPGWDSSSWVGIDGTYGSNDVLQAGIQQTVSTSGNAGYVAWYEWFAPQTATSPPYIFQTNIDNMPVFPGDEVFGGIYYVNGQGQVIFGNVTRGKYINLVLPAPSGATFNGNTAEWIMEVPNGGEPGASLPAFSPVVFSSAFSTGPGNALGDPKNGDSWNVAVGNRKLTSVSLNTMALEIDYAGAGWFQLHPETTFDHTTQEMSVVSRTPNNLDLFVIGFDNVVYSNFWSAAGGWNPGGWFQLHPEFKFDHTKQKIAAVSRSPNNLDLFVIGMDNAVWTTYWNSHDGWNPNGWFQIHPETKFDHTTQKLAAIARSPNNLDLFVIGFDNVVYSAYWSPASNWGGWFQLHPETKFDHTRQQLAVVSRTPNNLDLFVIGFDNVVYSNYWSAAGGWNPGGWFQLHPETKFDHTTQQLSVVSRSPNNIDIFVIGFDNVVYSIAWSAAGGWSGFFQLHPETKFDHTEQKIASVSRTPNNLDLFVIGFDNVVYSNYWSAAGGWNPGGWFQLDPATVFDHTTQQLGVVSRTPNNLDLFVIGFDNVVWSTFWAADFGGWA
jgi:hypothetical protein